MNQSNAWEACRAKRSSEAGHIVRGLPVGCKELISRFCNLEAPRLNFTSRHGNNPETCFQAASGYKP